MIAVQDYEHPNVYNSSDVELLSTISAEAAIAIENARLFEQAQEEIAERKQAEEKFAKAFRASPYISTIAQIKDGSLLELNEAFETILGYSRAEAIGHSTVDLGIWVNPLDRERLVRIIVANGRLEKEEVQFRTKGGQVLDCLYSGEMIELNREKYSLSIIEVITERKQAEEALQESELRFRTLIEKAPVAISISRNGICLYANHKFLEMIGLQAAEEAVGRPISEFFAAQFQEESKERTRRRALGLPVPVVFESVMQRSDGVQFPIEATVAAVHLADGDANMAFVFDISERKQAEEAKRQSEEKFRLSFMTGLDAFYWATLEDGQIVEINPVFENVFGYSRRSDRPKQPGTRPF